MRLMPSALVGVLAVGCATMQRNYGSPSGNPAVVMPSTTAKAVKDSIVGQLVVAGYTVTSANEYGVTLDRPAGTLVSMLAGSAFNPNATYRLAFTLAPSGNDVTVIGAVSIVTNPGSAFEKLNDVSGGKSGEQLNEFLQALREQFVAGANAAFPWIADSEGPLYYRAGCPDAPSIPSNRQRRFKTEAEAEAAGFHHSASRGC